jgi:hypothetical protein
LYVHGNEGLTGAIASVDTVTRGLGWQRALAPVEVRGEPGKADLAACTELGAVLAAGVMA